MADEPLQITVRPDDATTLPADPWSQFGHVSTMKPPAAAQAAQGADPATGD
jgi:hypothetical protein